MAEKGKGEYNGVEYSYECTTYDWFGVYKCRMDKSLLDGPNMGNASKELYTQEFQLARHAWQLNLECRGANLAAYLYSRNDEAVQVHFAFTVINLANKQLNTSFGLLYEFQTNRNWGCPELASIALIEDEGSGFLDSDHFIVALEVRLKLPENEVCAFSTESDTGVYTWKLKDLCERSPWKMWTEEFAVGGHKWRLYIYPYGSKHDKKYLGFYLCSAVASVVRAMCKFSAINHLSPERSVTKELEHTFVNYLDGRGFCQFLEIVALEDERFPF